MNSPVAQIEARVREVARMTGATFTHIRSFVAPGRHGAMTMRAIFSTDLDGCDLMQFEAPIGVLRAVAPFQGKETKIGESRQ